MTGYSQLFQRLSEKNEGAFVPFVTIGDPDLTTSRRIIETLIGSGADALELGLPFSDPIADGPVIQSAAVRALSSGIAIEDCWQLLEDVATSHPQVPIGLLVYSNLVVAPGLHVFYTRAAAAGVDSVLIADVPQAEVMPFAIAARESCVAPVLVAAPNTPAHRLRDIAELCQGYTYVVTRSGVTGTEAPAQLERPTETMIAELRLAGAPPAIIGFGVSRPEHVARAQSLGAAGVISGSAVVSRIAEHLGDVDAILESIGLFTAAMKQATNSHPCEPAVTYAITEDH